MATYIGSQISLLRMYKNEVLTQEEYEGLFEILAKYGPFIYEGNPNYNIDVLPSNKIREGVLEWIPISMEALRGGS
jgi:uncharacterized protein YqgQ